MGRLPCVKFKKGSWNEEEDLLLKNWVEKYGEGKWRHIPSRAGLNRCRKSCRLRWLNYLRPNIKRGDFAEDEADLIIRLHRLLGNRWSLIAARIPGRTGNDIKNYWNSHLSKKLTSEQKITSSLMSHPMDPPLLTTNSGRPREVSLFSCGNQGPEEGESREGDEEEETLSFWKSLLLEGQDVEGILRVNKNEIKAEDEDLFVGFEDLLQDMEKWGVLN